VGYNGRFGFGASDYFLLGFLYAPLVYLLNLNVEIIDHLTIQVRLSLQIGKNFGLIAQYNFEQGGRIITSGQELGHELAGRNVVV
jgi:hypothetical protein